MHLPVLDSVWKQQPRLNFISNPTLFWTSSWHKEALPSVSRRHFDFGNHFLSARHLVPAGWDMTWFCRVVARAEICQAGQSLCWGPDLRDPHTSLTAILYLPLLPIKASQWYLDSRAAAFAIQPKAIISQTPKSASLPGTPRTPSASASGRPSWGNQDTQQKKKELELYCISPTYATAQEDTPDLRTAPGSCGLGTVA